MSYDLYDWQARFNQQGLTYELRTELLEFLKPHVSLRSPLRMPELEEAALTAIDDEARIRDLVDWEIILGTSDIHQSLKGLKDRPDWSVALVDLLPNLTSLLLDALELMRQLDGADHLSDGSYWHQPSIAEHPQNQEFRDWTMLIDLSRDAFLAAAQVDADKARAEVERWRSCRYPLFRRLSFFAATATELLPANTALGWLLADEGWWLWSVETEREAIRLVVKLAGTLSSKDEALLLDAILDGPPQEMFGTTTDPQKLNRIVDREIWLRLSKYQAAAKKPLEGKAAETLDRIAQSYPDWKLERDERDEFPVWMGEPEEWYKKETSPQDLQSLEKWLMVDRGDMANDDWFDRCKSDFSVAIHALSNLGRVGSWPARRWRTALQVWSDESLVLYAWEELKDLLPAADDHFIETIAQPLSWWLQVVGKLLTDGVDQFHGLIVRVLQTQTKEPYDPGNDPLFKAINHAVGQAADAVIRWWYRQNLEDNQGLKEPPRGVFSLLCDRQIVGFRYGRIVMASNLIALFRVDQKWTERNLLPKLNWDTDSAEARAVWSGFLWAPRLHLPLLTSIKSEFLKTAKKYEMLGEFGSRYANLLTFVALEAAEAFSKKELALATSQLPPEGLERCANSLVQGLESAGDKRVEYWTNRVRPYIREIWPKSAEARTRAVAVSFGRLCMTAGDAFPDAVATLKPWLSGAQQGDVLLHQFRRTGLTAKFPEDALTFLDTTLGESSFVLVNDLNASLNEIVVKNPSLGNDPRFERLKKYARQLGG